jgi:hypothetical protein
MSHQYIKNNKESINTMERKKLDNIIIEDAKLIFRNFAGKETRFNREGKRNFCAIIDEPKKAKQMADDGWNVRTLQPRDDDDEPKAYLQVAVSYDNIPPKIVLIRGDKRTTLDEESVNVLDFADLKRVDLTIRPYEWDVNGKTGVKAYVKTLYAIIEVDEIEDRYEHSDEQNALPWEP